jgi:hypothetical protein
VKVGVDILGRKDWHFVHLANWVLNHSWLLDSPIHVHASIFGRTYHNEDFCASTTAAKFGVVVRRVIWCRNGWVIYTGCGCDTPLVDRFVRFILSRIAEDDDDDECSNRSVLVADVRVAAEVSSLPKLLLFVVEVVASWRGGVFNVTVVVV